MAENSFFPRWSLKTEGVIMPEERLPPGQTFVVGLQHVVAMFGATVLAPLLMGFDPNVSILFSGIATLIFFAVVGGRVPSYLGSSFAFIGPVAAVVGSPAAGTLNPSAIPLALGGIIVAGLIYTLIGLLVQVTGSHWIDRLMPPLVTGAVVMIIGLNLAPAARGLAKDSPLLALITIVSIVAIGLFARGLVARLAMVLGTIVGYLVALTLGGASAAGATYGGLGAIQ